MIDLDETAWVSTGVKGLHALRMARGKILQGEFHVEKSVRFAMDFSKLLVSALLDKERSRKQIDAMKALSHDFMHEYSLTSSDAYSRSGVLGSGSFAHYLELLWQEDAIKAERMLYWQKLAFDPGIPLSSEEILDRNTVCVAPLSAGLLLLSIMRNLYMKLLVKDEIFQIGTIAISDSNSRPFCHARENYFLPSGNQAPSKIRIVDTDTSTWHTIDATIATLKTYHPTAQILM